MPFLAAIPAAGAVAGGAGAAGAAGGGGLLSTLAPSLIAGGASAAGAGASAQAQKLRDEDARIAHATDVMTQLINNYSTVAGNKNRMEADAISTILSRIR